MEWDDSPKVASVKQTVSVLNRAISKLDDNDPASAQIMVGVAIHLLETLKADLEHHLATEKILRKALKQN